MTYNTIATMAADGDLQQRFIGCAAQENVENPDTWVLANRWELVTDTGIEAAYRSAQETGLAGIGKREDVITDGAILSIVQAQIAAEPPAGT